MTTYKIDRKPTTILSAIRKACCTAAVLSFLAAFGFMGNIESGAVDVIQGIPPIVAALGACVLFALLTAVFARLEAMEE